MLKVILLSLAAILLSASVSFGAICGTPHRDTHQNKYQLPRPLLKSAGYLPGKATGFDGVVSDNVLLTDNFRIFWSDGYDPADPEWADSATPGVPIWIDELVAYLERAFVDLSILGFAPPMGSDDYYLDIYIAGTGVLVNGFRGGSGMIEVTVDPDVLAFVSVNQAFPAAPYMVVGHDYSPYTSDELDLLRVTAAHELFHEVQLTYYPFGDPEAVTQDDWFRESWWLEASAQWMEEVLEPDVDNYINLAKYLLAFPELPLTLPPSEGPRAYGASIYVGYLWLSYGGAPHLVELFERMFDETAPLGEGANLDGALDRVISSAGGVDFNDSIARFWALAANPEDFWPDGHLMRDVDVPYVEGPPPGYPAELEATSQLAPISRGANLFDLGDGLDKLFFRFDNPPIDYRVWKVVISPKGSSETKVYNHPKRGSIEIKLDPALSHNMALVNVSDELFVNFGAYRASLNESRPIPANKTGSRGGCFIDSLGL